MQTRMQVDSFMSGLHVVHSMGSWFKTASTCAAIGAYNARSSGFVVELMATWRRSSEVLRLTGRRRMRTRGALLCFISLPALAYSLTDCPCIRAGCTACPSTARATPSTRRARRATPGVESSRRQVETSHQAEPVPPEAVAYYLRPVEECESRAANGLGGA